MKSDLKTRHGGKILADALAAQGVKLAFGVPGESYLPVLDGLHDLQDRLRFIVCRQEGGASYMAEAYGKLTGEPGVLFVTRGPGATNGAVGVHTGLQDSTPMVVFIGQVPNEFAEREAFQEMDYRRMYGQMTKWVAQIDRVERIPEYVSRAFHTAAAGRPGPVVLDVPFDVFMEAAAEEAPNAQAWNANISSRCGADPEGVKKAADMLMAAQRPVILCGQGVRYGGATKELRDKVQAQVAQGRMVLIVPHLMSFGGIEQGIRKRLEGLEYTMTAQALMPDARIVQWVVASTR